MSIFPGNSLKVRYDRLILLFFILLCFIICSSGSCNQDKSNPKASSGSSDWLSQIRENIKNMEYEATWQENSVIPKGRAGYHIANREQDLRVYFYPDEVAIVKRSDLQPLTSCRFQVEGIGRDGFLTPPGEPEISAEKNRLQYDWSIFRAIYENTEAGVKQRFVINEPEAGFGSLIMQVQIKGDFSPRIVKRGNAVEFMDHDLCIFQWGDWKALDDCGAAIHVSLSLNNNRMEIEIMDQGASYPVTIEGQITGFSPNADWFAEGNLIDGYFGSTVASAGDVNGDGYEDIMVAGHQYSNIEHWEGIVCVWYGSESGMGDTGNPANADWMAEGNRENARFGFSISSCGDVNGDGYDDIIIGAPYYHNNEANEGAAFIYYGSPTGLSSDPDVTLEINQPNCVFGSCVASAGDVNGDGYDDVIVGIPNLALYSLLGGVNVFYGSSTGIDFMNQWSAVGGGATSIIGDSVASAGDVNGDGYDDIIVGSRIYSNDQTGEGAAFVWFGGEYGLGPNGNPGNADWKSEGNQTDSGYGITVSSAGDVNGDGYDDVIIGAPFYTNDQTYEGATYIYHGSKDGLSNTTNIMIEGNDADSRFGTSVCSASDMDRDGYDDVLVGAGDYNGRGYVFIYSGSSTGVDTESDWYAACPKTSGLFGESAALAGDVNGDGAPDLIVGAMMYTNDENIEGAAFVYYGSPGDWMVNGNKSYAEMGSAVSTAGDVNGDGYSDVIVGAPGYDNGKFTEGMAFVYLGSQNGISKTPAWTAESNTANTFFGESVGTAGDINGDGYSDIIIGVSQVYSGQGTALIWHGSSTGLGDPGTLVNADWKADGSQSNDYLGCSVSSAGDVNGDGFSDIIIGAKGYANSDSNQGAALVWLGSASGLGDTGTFANADWKAEGSAGGVNLGSSVALAGDVNGDGYSDVIVGAPSLGNGTAFAFHGSSTGLSATSNWSAESAVATASFGSVVDTAGDVNGDGYSDAIVGAPLSAGYGKVYVYHGSSSGLNLTENWTTDSDIADSKFGKSAHTAGDVNGDGFGDVIVGAPQYKNNKHVEGAAFVWFGSSTGLKSSISPSHADCKIVCNQNPAAFGSSAVCAGDVNGDGFSDLIIGAPSFTGNYEYQGEGAVFLFYGSSRKFSSSANWGVEGNQTYAGLGTSAPTTGDVNGDGYADILIGAEYYDNGETNEGMAFVYQGSAAGPGPTPQWTAESNQADSGFVRALSFTGDVNGDGYDDIIIGAYKYDNDQTDEGAAFVWYGSAAGLGLNGNPGNAAWMAEGNQEGSNFGASVDTAGDVNGDGYADVLIGALAYMNGEGQEGAAFMWYGSASGLGANGTPDNADWKAEGDNSHALFGSSVATAGDVNGDSYSDIIISASQYTNIEFHEGAVFVYYGSYIGPPGQPSWMVESNRDSGLLGRSACTVGDVNGDGYADINIAVPGYSIPPNGYGNVFGWYGSHTGLGPGKTLDTADWVAHSSGYREFWRGSKSYPAGDVNGDGFADVIVAQENFSNDQNQEGRVLLYHGSAKGLSAWPDWSLEGNQDLLHLGTCASSAGDINGDGYADIIIGASYYTGGNEGEGKVMVFYGNGGLGFSYHPRQIRSDNSLPIAHLGLASSYTDFHILANAHTPFGRGKVKLEWEVMPLTSPLTGFYRRRLTEWVMTQTGTPLELNQQADIQYGGNVQHWWIRFMYHPAMFPYQRYSPWISIPWDGAQQTDFRIHPSTYVTLEELKLFLLGKISISEDRRSSADFNMDGEVDIADLIFRIK
jgi:hypothetical protein